jgi:uncharacterized protein YbjT (DUF2867 family)
MSASKERVFVTGTSGNIESEVVRGLVKKGIQTTAYVRDEKKTKDLFQNELKTGFLTIAVGDYTGGSLSSPLFFTDIGQTSSSRTPVPLKKSGCSE